MREFRTAICISQSPDITAIRVDLIKSKMMPHLVVRYALRFTQSLSLKLTAPKLSMEGSYYGVCLHRDVETITAHVPRIKGFLNSNVFFFVSHCDEMALRSHERQIQLQETRNRLCGSYTFAQSRCIRKRSVQDKKKKGDR